MKKFLVLLLVGMMVTGAMATDKKVVSTYSGRLRVLADADVLYHAGTIEGNQLQSFVTTGTAPLIIASTTLVDNLNVQYINSIEANATAAAGKLYPLDGSGLWPLGVIPTLPDSKLSQLTTADKVAGSAVEINNAGAIVDLGASGLGVQVEASNPSLQISSNELGVKIKAAGGLAKDASGLYVIDTGTDSATVTADTSLLAVGDVVYVSGNGTVAEADASDDTKNGVGVVTVVDASGTIVVSGLATGLSGLTANTVYYLSEAAAQYTSTPPSTAGSIVQPIGWGWNATTMMVNCDPSPWLNQ